MSDQMGSPLFSDLKANADFGQSFLFEPRFDDDVSDVLVKLTSPTELQCVPLERIIEFSRKRSDERQNFRHAVEGILETARSATDPNALEDYLSSKKAVITEALTDHQLSVEEISVGAVYSFTKITVRAGAASIIPLVAIGPVAAAAFAGLESQ